MEDSDKEGPFPWGGDCRVLVLPRQLWVTGTWHRPSTMLAGVDEIIQGGSSVGCPFHRALKFNSSTQNGLEANQLPLKMEQDLSDAPKIHPRFLGKLLRIHILLETPLADVCTSWFIAVKLIANFESSTLYWFLLAFRDYYVLCSIFTECPGFRGEHWGKYGFLRMIK